MEKQQIKPAWEITEKANIEQYVKRAFPTQTISRWATDQVSIIYDSLVFHTDLEKISHLGLEIVCIQRDQEKRDLIYVVVRFKRFIS